MQLIERQLDSRLVEHTPQYKKQSKRLENNIVETTLPKHRIHCNYTHTMEEGCFDKKNSTLLYFHFNFETGEM